MILVITTGGTIEGLDYDKEEKKSSNGHINIKSFLENAKVSFKYVINQAFKKDSRFITEEDRKLLAEKIKSSAADRVLITHGTITMVETAEYLGGLNIPKTILLVGSFILGSEKNTDAPFNLGFAIGALNYLEKGVYITMNGEVLTWDNVVKNMEQNCFEKKHT